MFNTIDSDLIRGHIDTIILKALYEGDRYGFDIIKEVEQKSGGQYVIKQPTLYSCLKRLEMQGFIKSYWGTKSIGGRRKYFTLTDMGRELFTQNLQNWEYSRTVIDKLILDRTDYCPPDSSNEIEFAVNEQNDDYVLDNQNEQEDVWGEFETQNDSTQVVYDSYNTTDDCGYEETSLLENDIEIQNADQFVSKGGKDEDIADNQEKVDEYLFINADEVQEQGTTTNEAVNEAVYDSQEQIGYYEPTNDVEETVQQETCDAIVYTDVDPQESAPERTDIDINEIFNRLYEQNSNEKSYVNTLETEEYTPTTKAQANISNFFTELDYEEISEEETQLSTSAFDTLPIENVAATDDAVILDNQESDDNSSNEFLSYHSPTNKLNFDEDGDEYILDRDYKKVIEDLIEKNTIKTSDYDDYDVPQKENFVEFSTEKIIQKDFDKLVSNVKDMGDDIAVKTHNSSELRKYSEKNYYYSNQLRLYHYGILFGLMLLEIVACFFIIELGIKSNYPIAKADSLLYLAAVLFALAFPVASVIIASTDYYRKKRFSISLKSTIIFRLITAIQCIVIIYALNVYNGIITGNIYNFLSSLLLPCVLTVNLVISPLIFNYLFYTKKFAVK